MTVLPHAQPAPRHAPAAFLRPGQRLAILSALVDEQRGLIDQLQERQRIAPRPLALIVGMMEKKDHGGFFEALKDAGPHVFTVTFEGKAADPEALAAVARGHGLESQSAGLNKTSALAGRRLFWLVPQHHDPLVFDIEMEIR
jgi:hypothetical protein